MSIIRDQRKPAKLTNDELKEEILWLCVEATTRCYEKRYETQTHQEQNEEYQWLHAQYRAHWDEAHKRGMLHMSSEQMETIRTSQKLSIIATAANELCQAPKVEKKFGSLN